MRISQKPVQEIVRDKRTWEERPEVPQAADDFSKPFRGWYGRRLPHCDKPGLIQFISYRLRDAMPTCRRHEWQSLLTMEDERARITKVEAYLDAGYGECFLRNPAIAQIIENNWLHFDGSSYRLIAWVIMPNHVHVVCEVWAESLPRIVKSWKAYTAAQANKLLARTGQEFWQPEFFDRYIRDEEHFAKTIRYVENNPVKAGLVKFAHEWPFSSANPQWKWSEEGLTARYLKGQLIKTDQLAAVTSRAPLNL